MTGVANLFTRDFYEIAARRLRLLDRNDGGDLPVIRMWETLPQYAPAPRSSRVRALGGSRLRSVS